MNSNLLNTPIDYLKGLGVNRSDLIKKELNEMRKKELNGDQRNLKKN